MWSDSDQVPGFLEDAGFKIKLRSRDRHILQCVCWGHTDEVDELESQSYLSSFVHVGFCLCTKSLGGGC